MAPLPLVPDVYQVTAFGTLYGKPCDRVINWHVARIGGGPDIPGDICTALAANDAPSFMNFMGTSLPTGYTYVSTRAVYLGDLTVPEATNVAGLSGTDAGVRGAAHTCLTIRHPVPVRGRGKDGRTNLPGPPVSAFLADQHGLNTQYHETITLNFADYQADMIAKVQAANWDNLGIVVLDRKLGTYLKPTTSQCDPYVNVHRRWVERLSRHRRVA